MDRVLTVLALFVVLVVVLWIVETPPGPVEVGQATPPNPATQPAPTATRQGSVIFIHPDGTSASTWHALRLLEAGPDGRINWDQLPHMAVYLDHMSDSLTATSNGAGTTHAYGVKVGQAAFGKYDRGDAPMIVDAQGRSTSVADQAIRLGLAVALVQTGIVSEPGTACFVAKAPRRDDHVGIVDQLLNSGVDIILGGGEQFFLPKGVAGQHGVGVRADGRNLIEEAVELGFTIVYTREQLLALPKSTRRVLGLFAHGHTFNDKTEEQLTMAGLPLYNAGTPSVAEMTQVALRLLEARDQRFLMVVEEEGTDNFGNYNNALGMIEAMRRSDLAIGFARDFVARHPDTLLLTCADSDAGGMRVSGIAVSPGLTVPTTLPASDENGAPMDGVAGTGTAPWTARPDAAGRAMPFAITWAARDDVSGAILVRAEGLNAEQVHGTFDNTQVAKLIRQTLFGTQEP